MPPLSPNPSQVLFESCMHASKNKNKNKNKSVRTYIRTPDRIFINLCSCDPSVCGRIGVLCAVRHAASHDGVRRNGIHRSVHRIFVLYRFDELFGSLQFRDCTKLVVRRLPSPQIPNVHPVVSASIYQIHSLINQPNIGLHNISICRFHSLHHTQFRTNYSLFMPFYDYVYNTADNSTDRLYQNSLKTREDRVDVVHLTHPTTLMSIFHLRTGFSALASRPYDEILPYKWLLWPFTWYSLLLTYFCRSPFPVERNKLGKLEMQTWAIPRYSFQVPSHNHVKLTTFVDLKI